MEVNCLKRSVASPFQWFSWGTGGTRESRGLWFPNSRLGTHSAKLRFADRTETEFWKHSFPNGSLGTRENYAVLAFKGMKRISTFRFRAAAMRVSMAIEWPW